jgi:hypothetical protein
MDPFELVTGRPETEETSEARTAVIALLRRAFQNRSFGRRYSVKISFNAGGEVQEVGPGEMVETGTAVNHRRWSARIGSFSMTRIIADQAYDSVPPGPVPIRLHMVRGDVLGPGIPSTWGVIRTARAALNGALLTCILTSVHGSEAPNRDWQEIEYCVEPESELLRIFSDAPGIYVVYDYGASPKPRGRPVLDQVTIAEAGRVVLQGSVSVATPDREALNPSLFMPTSGMFTGGVGLIGPSYQIQSRGRPAGSAVVRPVVIHATLSPEGRVVEAESLQTVDRALSESALDLVKKTTYETTFHYGYPAQQEIFITVE